MIKKRITNKKNRVLNRTGMMKCAVCSKATILVSHHISGRDIPNANHLFNLANVCSNCHMDIHSGEIIIEKWTMGTKGLFLAWHKKGQESFTGESASPYQIGDKNDI